MDALNVVGHGGQVLPFAVRLADLEALKQLVTCRLAKY